MNEVRNVQLTPVAATAISMAAWPMQRRAARHSMIEENGGVAKGDAGLCRTSGSVEMFSIDPSYLRRRSNTQCIGVRHYCSACGPYACRSHACTLRSQHGIPRHQYQTLLRGCEIVDVRGAEYIDPSWSHRAEDRVCRHPDKLQIAEGATGHRPLFLSAYRDLQRADVVSAVIESTG